jgi:hypothetical protein
MLHGSKAAHLIVTHTHTFVHTVNVRLHMICSFIDTLGKYTTCITRSLRRSSSCYWSAVDSLLTALLLERLLGVLALHWGSPNGACCSVKPDEARELIWLVPT